MIDILKKTGALLEGHFVLSSGKHTQRYVQCAKILRYPDKAKKVLEPVAKKLSDMNADILVGPAMGGIIVAYELGRQLGLEAVFTERVENKMQLRRGFEIKKGMRAVICEDVVTTGKSSIEVKEILEEMGASVIAIASIIDRTDKEIGLPVISALKLEIELFEKSSCPLCERGVETSKPGSREF